MATNNPYALQFTTTYGQYVDLGSPATFDLGNNGAFTYEFWVNTQAFKANTGIVSKRSISRYASGGFEYILGIQSDATLCCYSNNTATWVYSSATGMAINTWYHIAFVYDGATMAYYVNGVSKGTSSFTYIDCPFYNLILGSWNSGAVTNDPAMMLDEVRFWNYPRTITDINNNMSKMLYGDEVGLIGYWRLDEGGTSTIVRDSSNKGNNGIVYGTTWITGVQALTGTTARLNPINTQYTKYFWYEDTDNIVFKCTIPDDSKDPTTSAQYKFQINGVDVTTNTAALNLPITIDTQIAKSLFTNGANILSLVVTGTDTGVTTTTFNIYKEYRDYTPSREFLANNGWDIQNQGVVTTGGFTLVSNGAGTLNTNDTTQVVTKGKSYISNIIVDADDDIQLDVTKNFDMSLASVSDVGIGSVWKAPLNKTSFNKLNTISVTAKTRTS